MELKPGQDIFHYRLIEKIGEGGMGVVWKAVDTTLERDVAIKILPDHFSNDVDRVARFKREARAASAICTTCSNGAPLGSRSTIDQSGCASVAARGRGPPGRRPLAAWECRRARSWRRS